MISNSFWLETCLWAICHLAREYYAAGSLTLAHQTYQQALKLVPDRSDPPGLGLAYLGLGQLAYEWNDLTLASRYLNDALSFPSDDIRIETQLALAWVKIAGQHPSGAFDHLKKAEELAPPDLKTQCAAFRVLIALRQDDYSIGTDWFDTVELKNASAIEFLTYIKMLLVRGEAEEVLDLLDAQLGVAEENNHLVYQLKLMLLQAETFHVFGETAQAVSILSRVLEMTESEGFIRLFTDTGPPLTDLLKGVLTTRSPVSAMYANKLLDALNNRTLSTPPAISTQPLSDSLTDRELEVLQLLAAGYSNQDIAQILTVSPGTVKTHVKSIYHKMSVHSRTQAAARARILGLIQN